jgi:NAD(P)-dependent dehydrogenase (short-subunit alcohol dehydrogenase family)
VVRTAVERFGGLDVFHNNAGMPAESKPVTEISARSGIARSPST